jgi:hypothetical protein
MASLNLKSPLNKEGKGYSPKTICHPSQLKEKAEVMKV